MTSPLNIHRVLKGHLRRWRVTYLSSSLPTAIPSGNGWWWTFWTLNGWVGSLGRDFYDKIYQDKYDPMPYDITHSNALYYIEEEDALIVSSYRQCVIYKVDMSTGELIWIFGDPAGWREPWSDKLLQPVGETTWPYYQHGLEMTPGGTILLFDNGGSRNVPPQPPLPPEERYSRAVEYRVDAESGTVEEIWSYGPDQEHFVSPFISDADHLPETGNVLIADGGRFKDSEGKPMNTFGGHQWARILEVTYGETPRKYGSW